MPEAQSSVSGNSVRPVASGNSRGSLYNSDVTREEDTKRTRPPAGLLYIYPNDSAIFYASVGWFDKAVFVVLLRVRRLA